MSISAWDIYWVLQLDNIRGMFLTGAILACVAAVATLLLSGIATDRVGFPSKNQDAQWARAKRLSLRFMIVMCVLAPCAALIPSTKTAAAMIVLPALVNNKSVQHEAGDLYKLAKEALTQAVQPECPVDRTVIRNQQQGQHNED